MHGYIYLLHFARPVGNLDNPRGQARHYVGWAHDPLTRNLEHRAGLGAALTRAAVAAGITWELYVLTEGDRALERQIKNLKAAPRLCPVCGRQHPGGRLHLPATAIQLPLALTDSDPDPFEAPAARAGRVDGFEIATLRRWREARIVRYDLGDTGGDLPF